MLKQDNLYYLDHDFFFSYSFYGSFFSSFWKRGTGRILVKETHRSRLDKLVILSLIFSIETIVISVVCWGMSARKDIFDTFIKGRARMYKSFERWR